MLFLFVEIRWVVEVHNKAIDASADKPSRNEFLKHMQMFALAFGDDGCEHHDALVIG